MLLTDRLHQSARDRPEAPALQHKDHTVRYRELAHRVAAIREGLVGLGLTRDERVAVFLPKVPEAVYAMFAAAEAGAVFVPVNPVLKPAQVGYILRDCNVRILVTSASRASLLADELTACPDLRHLVLVDAGSHAATGRIQAIAWSDLPSTAGPGPRPSRIDLDMAAILYTSGSTGRPKGVVLSHRNMVAGAESVADYLGNAPSDRLLAVLPFSFDYGLSQLTTAFARGATVILMDYLVPRDVVRAVERHGVTGLAAVPPLWNQLAQLEWPQAACAPLRYLTNSGGAMPLSTTRALRVALPQARLYLMYGLTEAFRSTYLDPDEVDRRPDSMGKAIPNAEIMIVRDDGTECEPGEPGELVHRGALVAMGYWNDPERTAVRFRPAPGRAAGLPCREVAVWSGDRVRRDEAGYLYFVGRDDEMIKTSGYRVSPTEIEEVAYNHGGIAQAAALGVDHPSLGQGIVLLVQSHEQDVSSESVLTHCRAGLPAFMVPHVVEVRAELPRNANGKIDRAALRREFVGVFTEASIQ